MIKLIKKPNKNDDIFHYLEVIPINEQEYSFVLLDKNDPSQSFTYSAEKCYIPDPSIDSNFKSIFIDKPARFENFLNSVHFWPNGMEISNLLFLDGDFNIIGNMYNFNSLRADMACKGLIKIKNLNHLKETLLDVEIQINWLPNLDDRLFEYGSLLRNSYSNKIREEQRNKKEKDNYDKERIYLKNLFIAIILVDKKNNLNEIKLTKNEKGQTPFELRNFKIL